MLTQRTSKVAVRLGNFLFTYRNVLFPATLIVMLIFARPTEPFSDASLYGQSWRMMGLLFAFLGEGIRLFTIGFRYIDRGGKNRKVYASQLVSGGIFAHVRNPMYIGNILIVTGFSMLTASLTAFLISVPLFCFIYRCIVAAEEDYLLRSFGNDFVKYTETVNRFWPRFRGLGKTLSGMTFEWKRSLRKDYGNLAMVGIVIICLPLWRQFFEAPSDRFLYLSEGYGLHENIEMAGWYLSFLLVAYLVIWALKKTGRLADSKPVVQN